MESLPTDVWPLFLQGEMFVVQRFQHGLTSSSNQHLCSMGRIVKVAYDKAIALLANSLHSCSQLVRNLTNMINELSKDPTHHLEESNTRIQADNSDRMKLWERQYQCIDRYDPSGRICHCVQHCSWITDCCICECQEWSTNLQKLPQGFYNKICSYVVTIDTPMKGINLGAVATVDIKVVFNRTRGIIGSKEFDLH